MGPKGLLVTPGELRAAQIHSLHILTSLLRPYLRDALRIAARFPTATTRRSPLMSRLTRIRKCFAMA
jgi:hypothetical protein